MRGWRRLFRNPFRPDAEAEAIREEVTFHIEELERRLMAAGQSPADARAEARRRFGDPDAWAAMARSESAHRARADARRGWTDALLSELRASLRHLRRRPGHTAATATIMVLGIASGATVGAVVDAVVFRPLPVSHADRLVVATGENERSPNWGVSAFTYERWRSGQRSFASMSAVRETRVRLLDPWPDEIGGLYVESSFFDVVGTFPAMGRAFTTEEDDPDAPRVAVLTHDVWRNRFGGETDILGRVLRLGSFDATVVGIMPPTFRWEVNQFDGPRSEGAERGILLSGAMGSGSGQIEATGSLNVVARLADGATVASADADLDRIMADLVQRYPVAFGDADGWGAVSAHVWSIKGHLAWLVRDEVLLLGGAVALLLALVALNTGNLLVVGLLDRRPELALRASLGAARGRLVGQVLLEAALVWIGALAAGLALAALVLPYVRALAPPGLPFADTIVLHPRVVAGTASLAVLLWLTSALLPAIDGARVDLMAMVNRGSRSVSRRSSVANLLIVGQVALACTLLGSATLLVRTHARLLHVPPGLDTHDVFALEVRGPADFVAPTSTFEEAGVPIAPEYRRWFDDASLLHSPTAAFQAFVTQTLNRMESVPGVQAATMVNFPPLSPSPLWNGMQRPDQVGLDLPRSERDWARIKWVAPGYFRALGIDLVRGRTFDRADRAGAEKVAVVNPAYAERFLRGDAEPGRPVRLTLSAYLPEEERALIGVVGNTLHSGPHIADEAVVYVPVAQIPAYWTDDQIGWTRRIWFLVRHDGDPAQVQRALREAIWAGAPGTPIRTTTTLDAMLRELTSRTRFFVVLLTSFAVTAFVLAAAALAATLGQQVRRRTRELGVRKALGAHHTEVFGRTLRHGGGLALAGIVAGTGGAWILARLLAARVEGVEGWSPTVQVAVAAVLLLAALAASAGPALRAARVDPVTCLQAD